MTSVRESIRLRPATASDEAFIRDMQWVALYVAPDEPPYPRSVVDEAAIARYHRDFGARAGDVGFIAETATGRPVGAVWARRLTSTDPGFGHVDDGTPELAIAVLPSHRGCGIGSALLERLLAEVPRCSLSVDRRNRAVRLYERAGFEIVADDGQSLTMLWSRPPA